MIGHNDFEPSIAFADWATRPVLGKSVSICAVHTVRGLIGGETVIKAHLQFTTHLYAPVISSRSGFRLWQYFCPCGEEFHLDAVVLWCCSDCGDLP